MLAKIQHAGVVALRTFTGLVVALPVGLKASFVRGLATSAIAAGIAFLVDLAAHN